jgi:hypothetical protein
MIGCDPYWVVESSEVVDESGSEDCVEMALKRIDALSEVTIYAQEHRTLTGRVVRDPSTFSFNTKYGIANLTYVELARGNWKLRVFYTGIGLSKPANMTDDTKRLTEEVAEYVMQECFANDV